MSRKDLFKEFTVSDAKLLGGLIVTTGVVVSSIVFYLNTNFNNINVQLAILKANTQNIDSQINILNTTQSLQNVEIEQLSGLSADGSARLTNP